MIGNDLIQVRCEEDHPFVYIPPRLNRQYLQQVLSDSLEKTVTIASCRTTNLCASVWGGVSHSGATVLRLSLELDTGEPLDVVVKILCPDSVNLFKLDKCFGARIAEIRWAKWWGDQDVSWVPLTYDTRCDCNAREFWILQEYFPQVGWPDIAVEGMKAFRADSGRLRLLIKHAADLHAHSRSRIAELSEMFPEALRPTSTIVPDVAEAMADTSFLDSIGVGDHERKVVGRCCNAAGRVPAWVEQWDAVCVTADLAPDNIGIRKSGSVEEAVTFDWSSTSLGPMEAEMDVLFGRLSDADPESKRELLQYYLDTYSQQTGRSISREQFMLRMPWWRFLAHLDRIAGCVNQLRWVPYETRSRDYIHLCVRLCERVLAELAFE